MHRSLQLRARIKARRIRALRGITSPARRLRTSNAMLDSLQRSIADTKRLAALPTHRPVKPPPRAYDTIQDQHRLLARRHVAKLLNDQRATIRYTVQDGRIIFGPPIIHEP